ncbi:MAG: hypothetical protein ACPGVO_07505 [Spirulinaceae cyanobacterium]
MEIVIGSGVDNVLFGFTERQVVEKLGNPDKVWNIDYGNPEDRDIELTYNELRLVLKIEKENESRLGWIEVHNQNATLWGIHPWRTSKSELLALLVERLDEDYEIEEYRSMECYLFDENWVELQYEFDRLYCFKLGVLYGEDDQPLWPNRIGNS